MENLRRAHRSDGSICCAAVMVHLAPRGNRVAVYCTTQAQPPQQAALTNERLILTGPSLVTLSGTACVKYLMQMELTQ